MAEEKIKTGARKKPAKKKAAKPEAPPAVLAKSQAFVVERINRAMLKSAPYNPRSIGESEKKRLREGIARNGLVGTITWNKRTGNVVGGHQRLTAMDSLEGSANYLLDVAVIDVDESREKELNVLLNNQQAQGVWNYDMLGEILRDSSIDLTGTGFDAASVHQLFGETVSMVREDPLDDLADKIREARDRYDAANKTMSERRGSEYYLVVIFRNEAECSRFIGDYKLPDNRYQSGDDIRGLITNGSKPNEKEQTGSAAKG